MSRPTCAPTGSVHLLLLASQFAVMIGAVPTNQPSAEIVIDERLQQECVILGAALTRGAAEREHVVDQRAGDPGTGQLHDDQHAVGPAPQTLEPRRLIADGRDLDDRTDAPDPAVHRFAGDRKAEKVVGPVPNGTVWAG